MTAGMDRLVGAMTVGSRSMRKPKRTALKASVTIVGVAPATRIVSAVLLRAALRLCDLERDCIR